MTMKLFEMYQYNNIFALNNLQKPTITIDNIINKYGCEMQYFYENINNDFAKIEQIVKNSKEMCDKLINVDINNFIFDIQKLKNEIVYYLLILNDISVKIEKIKTFIEFVNLKYIKTSSNDVGSKLIDITTIVNISNHITNVCNNLSSYNQLFFDKKDVNLSGEIVKFYTMAYFNFNQIIHHLELLSTYVFDDINVQINKQKEKISNYVYS